MNDDPKGNRFNFGRRSFRLIFVIRFFFLLTSFLAAPGDSEGVLIKILG